MDPRETFTGLRHFVEAMVPGNERRPPGAIAASLADRPPRLVTVGRNPGASKAAPCHPGEVLEARFLMPRRITQQALARALQVSRRRVNELIRGHRGVTADTAIRLANFFGNDAEYWMRLQMAWDLHRAFRSMQQESARALAP